MKWFFLCWVAGMEPASTLLCPGTRHSGLPAIRSVGAGQGGDLLRALSCLTRAQDPRDSHCAAWKAGKDFPTGFCLLDFSTLPQSSRFFHDFSFASSVNIVLEARDEIWAWRSLIDTAPEQITRDETLPSCCIQVGHDFHQLHIFGIFGEDPSFSRFGVSKELAWGMQLNASINTFSLGTSQLLESQAFPPEHPSPLRASGTGGAWPSSGYPQPPWDYANPKKQNKEARWFPPKSHDRFCQRCNCWWLKWGRRQTGESQEGTEKPFCRSSRFTF